MVPERWVYKVWISLIFMKFYKERYGKGELELCYNSLTKKERKNIDDFIQYCEISAGQRKLKDIRRSIIQFRDIVNKPFDNMTLVDLRNYLAALSKSGRMPYTLNGIKSHIKRFLKWKFPDDWTKRFNNLQDIKLDRNAFNSEKINEHTMLTKEQIEKIISFEQSHIRKTFFMVLYESGLRPFELRKLKWNDINFFVDGDVSELNIYSTKTKKFRAVYVKESTKFLTKLQEMKKTESPFVFPSADTPNDSISKNTSIRWVKSMGRRVDLEIFPYLLRHTRANELYLNMPEKVAQKFMGHKRSMSDLYSHLSSKDVKDTLLKTVYKFEEYTPEQKNKYDKQLAELQEKIDKLYSIIGSPDSDSVDDGVKAFAKELVARTI